MIIDGVAIDFQKEVHHTINNECRLTTVFINDNTNATVEQDFSTVMNGIRS